MNKQDTLRNLLVAGAVVVFIMAIGPALLPPPPTPPISTTPTTESPTPTTPVNGAPNSALPSPAPATVPDKAGGYTIVQDEIERTFDLGAIQADNPYRTKLTLSNIGASIETALLADHMAKVRSEERYQLLAALNRPDGDTLRSFSVEKVNLDGADIEISRAKWRSSGVKEYTAGDESGQLVELQLDIQKDGVGVVRLSRTWRLPQQPEKSGRHDLFSDLRVENLSDQPHRVILTYNGGLGIPQDRSTDDRVVDFAVLDGLGRIAGARKTNAVAHQSPQPTTLFSLKPGEADQRLSWAATANTYFTCTIAPVTSDGRSTAAYLADVSLIDADANPLTADDATVRFVTTVANVAASSNVTYSTAVFLGEKDGRAFRQEADYLARNYYFQISAGFGWCTFGFLVEVMIWLLNSLFFVVRDFGVAIIILVLLVRAMLHPLTKKGQINMVRMQHKMAELAPKIEELKKKFGNDKVRLNQEMMKLNINPAGQLMTCLPMFIQMPIWVALFLSLSNNILMRHEPLSLTWIHDLTAPDAMFALASPFVIPMVGWHIYGFNLLPILVAVFMYLQQKTAPKPPVNPNMSEEQRMQQEMMQKMMPMMSIMMLLIFYNMPAGLNLYIMFSSLFGWLEQVHIRKHIKQREAEGTLHKQPTKTPPPGDDEPKPPSNPTFFEKLQKMAEEAQKAQKSQRSGKVRR